MSQIKKYVIKHIKTFAQIKKTSTFASVILNTIFLP